MGNRTRFSLGLRVILGFMAINGIANAGTTVVGASASALSVKEADGTSPWRAVDAAAHTATIGYTSTVTVGGQTVSNALHTEFKCVDTQGVFGPRSSFAGDFLSKTVGSASATVQTIGHSSFSDPGNSDAPVYYSASWTTTTTATLGASTGSGTYDPWSVTFADLMDMGYQPGQQIDLYFQAKMAPGSGFSVGSGENAFYGFHSYLDGPAGTINLFDAAILSEGNGFRLVTEGPSDPNVEAYFLAEHADKADESPETRIRNGQKLGSEEALHNAILGNIGDYGSIDCATNLGFVIHGFVIPRSDPGKPLYELHLDTGSAIQAVPEPTTLAVLLPLSLLVIRKRTRK